MRIALVHYGATWVQYLYFMHADDRRNRFQPLAVILPTAELAGQLQAGNRQR